MIFIACNFFRYKFNTPENLNYRDNIVNIVQKNFPKEEILLPYSQYSRNDLVKKLQCEQTEIVGSFNSDLPTMIKYCSKLVFFPSENNYIGSGMFHEITEATKKGIPCFAYNTTNCDFTQSYELTPTGFYDDIKLYNIFCRKVVFL